MYIITPFCSGGEVFDIVADNGRFEEAEARSLFRQALNGLLFLKQHGVCHRCVSSNDRWRYDALDFFFGVVALLQPPVSRDPSLVVTGCGCPVCPEEYSVVI